MKINDVRPLQSTDTAPAGKPSNGSHGGKVTHATTAIGSVSISEASRSLQAKSAGNAEAPFDAKRVDAIKAAISAGHFKVDPQAVACKVIDSASQLLAGQSS